MTPGAYFRKMWQYRHLVLVMAKRDIKGMFAQTMLGWLWLIVRPLITLVLFTVFFDNLLELDTGSISYPAFAFSGMILWYFFSGLSQTAGTATSQSSDLIRKIYFPKLLLPLSKLAASLFEFALHFLLLLILLLVTGHGPKLTWLLAPLFVLPALLTGLMLAIWLNVLSVRFRDLQQLIPQLTNFAIWLTPVFYPVTIIPEQYHSWLYLLNPIAGSIDGLRWALFGTGAVPIELFFGLFMVVLLLLIGIWAFIRGEQKMTDLL